MILLNLIENSIVGVNTSFTIRRKENFTITKKCKLKLSYLVESNSHQTYTFMGEIGENQN